MIQISKEQIEDFNQRESELFGSSELFAHGILKLIQDLIASGDKNRGLNLLLRAESIIDSDQNEAVSLTEILFQLDKEKAIMWLERVHKISTFDYNLVKRAGLICQHTEDNEWFGKVVNQVKVYVENEYEDNEDFTAEIAFGRFEKHIGTLDGFIESLEISKQEKFIPVYKPIVRDILEIMENKLCPEVDNKKTYFSQLLSYVDYDGDLGFSDDITWINRIKKKLSEY